MRTSLLKSALARQNCAKLFKRQTRAFGSGLVKFDYKDPLMFDGLLTDEERMIEELAKQYA